MKFLPRSLGERPEVGRPARQKHARSGTGPALKIAVTYLVVSIVWILVTDQVAVRLASETVSLTRIQTLKGWLFVVGSALLLFALVTRELRLKQAAVDGQIREERRFRALIEHVADVIAVLEEDGTVRYSSPSVERMIGYASPESEGKKILDIIAPEDVDDVARLLADVTASPGEEFRAEFRVQHRDGTTRQIDATLRSLLHDPSVGGVVLNARDVTDHRRLEEQFRQAQKMEAVGRLAGGIVHDFNNALTVIQGCGENLLGALDPDDPRSQEVEDLLRAASHGQGVVRQLLTFSRREPLELETIDINDRIREIVSVLNSAVPSRIDMRWELDADPALVRMGRDHVEQVLMNLVVNARDAIRETGQLVVRTETVPTTSREGSGRSVRLTVSDTGEGIPVAVREKIFEPFFTTKSEGQGTGLGLAVVFGVVQQNGGFITFETEIGRGTVFDVRFPVVEPGQVTEAPDRSKPAGPPADLSGTEAVLVVEDEPAVLSLAARSLRKYGYRVLEAADGVEALEVLEDQGPVDLVLTDTVMPRMGGLQLAERLATHRTPPHVLLVSGHPREEIGPVEGGQFLEKPYTPTTLAGRVRQILDRSIADGS